MASELYVETLKGLTSGANANKVIVPAGQTLDISGSWSPPAGTVLQVVESNMDGNGIFSTSATSFVDVGLSASITPASASSKILVRFNAGGLDLPGVANEAVRLQILRGSTTIYGGSNAMFTGSTTVYGGVCLAYEVLDSPSTTSATTYKIQMQTRLGNSCSMNAGNAVSTFAVLTLTEIAG